MRLPFSSESQGVISKNSFSCLMTIVTCDRGVGRRAPFILKKNCELSQFFFKIRDKGSFQQTREESKRNCYLIHKVL
ncbi:hypothetical protein CNX66_09425 [Enterococcus faecium]|nr:hypothetical protein CNX66_09425 [Enterococcus faecium]